MRRRNRDFRSARVPPPGKDKRGAEGHIAYLLRQAQAAVRRAHDAAFADAGLTTPQFIVLTLLRAYPQASGADLARAALLTPQTINLIVRNLERDGLLVRSSHDSHGRILCADITPRGLAALARCKRAADAIERRLLSLAAGDSQAAVRRWLATVAAELSRD